MDGTALTFFVLGLLAGGVLAALAFLDAARSRERAAALAARLEAERTAAREKLALLDDARARLGDAFKALSADALRDTTASFLELARAALSRERDAARGDLDRRQAAIGELVAPVRESLGKLDAQLRDIERAREGAYGALGEQLRAVGEAQGLLRAEAQNLVKALRAPQVRGRWGELQLRRVVELAGLVDRCDFHEQVTAEGEQGRQRPDLVVHLPGGRDVVVDAKAPLAAYLEAVEAKDEAARAARLADHARQLRAHVEALSRKAYWEQFRAAPELVVLFLPGESFYAAALEADPSLLEASVERRVLVATPTTLIALLKAVAAGWRQAAVTENAAAVAALGRELHQRLGGLAAHLARLGAALDGAVHRYNEAVGSLEARVLVT
ncbi:MAG TPA: DNA recombination protein RmuC, partial [Anaeromyxobacteraceae bacterium]|nr:DNA recombination protein RmuC [Anaeromyxobacteraceae bacterium]